MGNKSASFFSNYIGLRIIHVQPLSPAESIGHLEIHLYHSQGLVPFIDFIIGIETSDHQVPHLIEQADMLKFLAVNENQNVILEIYSILTQQSRKLTVNLNKNWPNSDGLLGILFRAENYSRACQNIFRISQVYENSPASQCQLKSEEDFLLGVAQIKIYTFANFQQFVAAREKSKQYFFICVFNSKENTVRYCQIQPNSQWGGQGLLGCEFNFGLQNKFQFNDDLSKIKYIQVDFFPPKIDNSIQNENEKQQQQQKLQQEQQQVKQKEENCKHCEKEAQSKRQIAANMLNLMNQNVLMQQTISESQQQDQSPHQQQTEIQPEKKSQEKQIYKFYSEKAQLEYEINQEDLLDTNIDIKALVMK